MRTAPTTPAAPRVAPLCEAPLGVVDGEGEVAGELVGRVLELAGIETDLEEEVGVVDVGRGVVLVAGVEAGLELGGTDPELEPVAEPLGVGAPLELGFWPTHSMLEPGWMVKGADC